MEMLLYRNGAAAFLLVLFSVKVRKIRRFPHVK